LPLAIELDAKNDYYGHHEGDQVSTWRATQAKAQFSAVLDRADEDGPQLVERRKSRYWLVTDEQWKERAKPAVQVENNEPRKSLWDKLRLPPEHRTDEVLFPRVKGKAKWVKF
jgi:hypothetical protein